MGNDLKFLLNCGKWQKVLTTYAVKVAQSSVPKI